MNKDLGFLKYRRKEPQKLTVRQRLRNFQEFELPLPLAQLENQASRCMDCGVPFCHSFGCPLGNRIPEWIELVAHGHWKKALTILHSTDNFPEITGRICPAPCEAACTLNIDGSPVTIRHIELQIIERGFRENWIVPKPASISTGKRVAVIGSGPAGLAAAQQLARAGHKVTVYEKDDEIGGLMRYGIPDFKLEKSVLDRRLEQMIAEGVIFEPTAFVGVDILPSFLLRRFDAILLTIGATEPRELKIPGRSLAGISQAIPYLTQQNKKVAGMQIPKSEEISAKGKQVVVIGGGDTGSDCVGTANRQGAKKVTQIEILPESAETRSEDNPWPTWPRILYTSSSQEEGCRRLWSATTRRFDGRKGQIKKIHLAELSWNQDKTTRQWKSRKVSGSDFTLRADLVLLAMGFVHAHHGPLFQDLGLAADEAGNIQVDENLMTNVHSVFSAGDAVTGASLIVQAIANGRAAAENIDLFLQKK